MLGEISLRNAAGLGFDLRVDGVAATARVDGEGRRLAPAAPGERWLAAVVDWCGRRWPAVVYAGDLLLLRRSLEAALAPSVVAGAAALAASEAGLDLEVWFDATGAAGIRGWVEPGGRVDERSAEAAVGDLRTSDLVALVEQLVALEAALRAG